MTENETGLIVKYIAANWPASPMSPDTLEVFVLELQPLDFEETLAVLRARFADKPFPPTPMQLRAAVSSPEELSYQAAMSELLDAVASVGYASPEPEWSHPAIADMVRYRGGWREVCMQTPARAAVDARGVGTFNTWAAQFRDEFRIVVQRYEREHGGTAIAGAVRPALEDAQ